MNYERERYLIVSTILFAIGVVGLSVTIHYFGSVVGFW